jgi:hypothetical protein
MAARGASLFLLAAMGAGSIWASAAQAAVVSWELVDVTFAGGGTLTGTFSDDGYLLDFDLTSQGGAITGASYVAGDYTSSAPDSFDLHKDTYANTLELVFRDPLSTPEADNPIVSGYETFGSYADPQSDVTRAITGGYAEAPEPASWALMLAGMGALAVSLRARRPAKA